MGTIHFVSGELDQGGPIFVLYFFLLRAHLSSLILQFTLPKLDVRPALIGPSSLPVASWLPPGPSNSTISSNSPLLSLIATDPLSLGPGASHFAAATPLPPPPPPLPPSPLPPPLRPVVTRHTHSLSWPRLAKFHCQDKLRFGQQYNRITFAPAVSRLALKAADQVRGFVATPRRLAAAVAARGRSKATRRCFPTPAAPTRTSLDHGPPDAGSCRAPSLVDYSLLSDELFLFLFCRCCIEPQLRVVSTPAVPEIVLIVKPREGPPLIEADDACHTPLDDDAVYLGPTPPLFSNQRRCYLPVRCSHRCCYIALLCTETSCS
ncbi:hypothetical protein NL676_013535 [Syzygium grande]|nr:hypothetical protein NL676_013535 [Syzygium grande]